MTLHDEARTTGAASASASPSAALRSTVVLLHGPGGGGAADFDFLLPMLARTRDVLTIRVPDAAGRRVIDWNESLADTVGGATVVAIGGHSSEAIRAARHGASLVGRIVLIDPEPADADAGAHGMDESRVLVLSTSDERRTLLDRPARILSLIEEFIDGARADRAPDTNRSGVAAAGIRNAVARTSLDGATEVDAVIVGAGFAGLGAGIRLARRGDTSFVILERAHDVGGTWRDNVYPGVACDIPSHLYSFSFLPKPDWSGFFAGGSEIHDYLRDAVRTEGLERHLRLGSEVLEMRWLADDRRWRVRTGSGDYVCRTLIVAAGRLSDARMPEVPGLDTFPGPVMHSSAWDDSVELQGRRVGVVGTGASAAQLIPQLAQTASSVIVFQRSAPYVVPRPDRPYTRDEQAGFAADPVSHAAMRDDLFWGAETAFAERMRVPGFIDRLRDRALGHLEAQVADPGLRAAATPDYEIGCKRVIISNDYYPALASPSVTLEPSALRSVVGGVATSADGAEFELDVLVFATGFESTRPPFAARTFGAGGIRLADMWASGMRAHASTTVHGFPNLFVLDGPNASLGHNSAVVMIEAQIDYVLAALDHRDSNGVDALDVSLEAQDAYTREIDAKAASTVWLTGGCESWYVDERSRRLTLLWPDFAYAFQRRLSRFDAENYVVVEAQRHASVLQSSISPV
ncbi:Predicted flavoprotein CzcO associated with the cation diffusion facilitator CzcD [Agreia bicolorata]|uniref:Predicted flavoprotein CzcO associated with the cation diffusion facilitator CzcD n=1 Tax=Agreia bicolorata TaxID=110935 RepID=A0A1T4YPB8_9MICO|nr:NAD(P)/FAD-dependent oxidoreductase [Agreia bicolorata]SKB03101.1 Predicted flavoprotein CzcO associated with the cation diffusion facilitator CzcD [Agreia bicolorata]